MDVYHRLPTAHTRNKFLAFLFLGLYSFMSFAQAESKHIYDYAKVIEADRIKQYDELLSNIEEKHQLRIEAVIVPSFQNDTPENVINHFITELSNRQSPVQFNALLFIAINDLYASIHTSSNIQNYYPPDIQQEITDKVKQQIQAQNYQDALKDGIGGIVHYFDENLKQASQRTLWDIVLDNFVLIALVILLVVAFKVSRKQPRTINENKNKENKNKVD